MVDWKSSRYSTCSCFGYSNFSIYDAEYYHLGWCTITTLGYAYARRWRIIFRISHSKNRIGSLFCDPVGWFSNEFLGYIPLVWHTHCGVFKYYEHTATATILIPIAGLLGTQSPIVVPLIIGLSASCALLFPISTPPNAIAYSTGKLQQKDFRSNGLLIGILGPLLITIWILLIHG